MKQTREMKVTVHEAEEMERMLREPDESNARDELVFDREVTFDNGYRIAVQVIASAQPAKESCWSQGVLFTKDGYEVSFTDVGESFLGEHKVFDGDEEYAAIVTTDMRDHYPNGECPDCGEPISCLCVNGESCSNCGHVFYTPQAAE